MPTTGRIDPAAVETRNEPISIGRVTVPPGRKMRIELPFAHLPAGTDASLPVAVINGRTSGPHVWVSGGIHGDEINGVEVVRKVMRALDAKSLRGAVIAVPIVNPLGFMMRSRYVPDRRDLNRVFPGSPRGSTASRLAHLFMTEIVAHCSVGIDCHTASNHRTNIPQLRADIEDPGTLELARAFGARFTIKARVRDGSLRQSATEQGIKMLLYEAGQADRIDEEAVIAGFDGVMRTLRSLGMIDLKLPAPSPTDAGAEHSLGESEKRWSGRDLPEARSAGRSRGGGGPDIGRLRYQTDADQGDVFGLGHRPHFEPVGQPR